MRAAVAVLFLCTSALAGCDGPRKEPWNRAGSPASAVRRLEDGDLVARRRVSPGASAFVAGAVSGGPLVSMLAVALALVLVHRRRARAERAVSGSGPLWDGPQRIEGVVEVDAAAPGPPVAIHVHQRGFEAQGKGGWSHGWKEVSRDVLVRPFTLRRADGVVVRVEPDPRPLLQAVLDKETRHARDSRTRSVELRPGTRVQIAGELTGTAPARPEAVYRGTPSSLVLRPPRGGRMVISAEPPGDVPASRSRFHTIWALVLASVVALLGGTALREYLVLAADGDVIVADATHTQTWKEWVKPKNSAGFWVPHYAVRAQTVRSKETVTLQDECSVTIYDCVRNGTCLPLPFVVSRHFPEVHQIGREPTLTDGIAVILVIVSLTLLLLYPVLTVSSRRWYLKSKVVDSGSGRLG